MGLERFKLNSGGMEALLKSGDVRSQLDGPASAVASAMRSSAPRDTGALADSIEVVDDTTDRAVKRIVANAPYALVVEAKTGFMTRSLGAAG